MAPDQSAPALEEKRALYSARYWAQVIESEVKGGFTSLKMIMASPSLKRADALSTCVIAVTADLLHITSSEIIAPSPPRPAALDTVIEQRVPPTLSVSSAAGLASNVRYRGDINSSALPAFETITMSWVTLSLVFSASSLPRFP